MITLIPAHRVETVKRRPIISLPTAWKYLKEDIKELLKAAL
jgi:hypothetical protein